MSKLKNKPYDEIAYVTLPTKTTLFWRRCFIKQIYMFFKLNLKIMRIVVGGHS